MDATHKAPQTVSSISGVIVLTHILHIWIGLLCVAKPGGGEEKMLHRSEWLSQTQHRSHMCEKDDICDNCAYAYALVFQPIVTPGYKISTRSGN